MPEARYLKDREENIGSAVRRLEEALRIGALGFKGRVYTIDILSKRLHNKLREDSSLEETLFGSDAGATATVLRTVWDAALPNLIGRQLVQVITRDQASIKVPKATKARVGFIASSGNLPVTEETYSFVTITARKSGGRAAISKDMVEDAEWDVIQRQLAEMGRAVAEFESQQIISQMIADAGNSSAASIAGRLSFGDVADMWATMARQDREPDVLALNPQEFGDLLKDSAIQNLVSFRQEDFVPGGRIAYLPGMRIVVSSLVPAGTALMVASRFAGVLFIRRDISVEEFDDPINDLVHVPVTERWSYATLDRAAIGKITGA